VQHVVVVVVVVVVVDRGIVRGHAGASRFLRLKGKSCNDGDNENYTNAVFTRSSNYAASIRWSTTDRLRVGASAFARILFSLAGIFYRNFSISVDFISEDWGGEGGERARKEMPGIFYFFLPSLPPSLSLSLSLSLASARAGKGRSAFRASSGKSARLSLTGCDIGCDIRQRGPERAVTRIRTKLLCPRAKSCLDEIAW